MIVDWQKGQEQIFASNPAALALIKQNTTTILNELDVANSPEALKKVIDHYKEIPRLVVSAIDAEIKVLKSAAEDNWNLFYKLYVAPADKIAALKDAKKKIVTPAAPSDALEYFKSGEYQKVAKAIQAQEKILKSKNATEKEQIAAYKQLNSLRKKAYDLLAKGQRILDTQITAKDPLTDLRNRDQMQKTLDNLKKTVDMSVFYSKLVEVPGNVKSKLKSDLDSAFRAFFIQQESSYKQAYRAAKNADEQNQVMQEQAEKFAEGAKAIFNKVLSDGGFEIDSANAKRLADDTIGPLGEIFNQRMKNFASSIDLNNLISISKSEMTESQANLRVYLAGNASIYDKYLKQKEVEYKKHKEVLANIDREYQNKLNTNVSPDVAKADQEAAIAVESARHLEQINKNKLKLHKDYIKDVKDLWKDFNIANLVGVDKLDKLDQLRTSLYMMKIELEDMAKFEGKDDILAFMDKMLQKVDKGIGKENVKVAKSNLDVYSKQLQQLQQLSQLQSDQGHLWASYDTNLKILEVYKERNIAYKDFLAAQVEAGELQIAESARLAEISDLQVQQAEAALSPVGQMYADFTEAGVQSFETFFDSIIDGTTSLSKGLKKLGQSLVKDFIGVFTKQASKMMMDWMTSMLKKLASSVKDWAIKALGMAGGGTYDGAAPHPGRVGVRVMHGGG
jgi:hypothetical protein